MNNDILSDLIITKVLSVSSVYNEKNTGAKKLSRPSWAIVYKYEGETVYTINDKKYISNIDNIIILPKGCNYEWRCNQSGHFVIIDFDSPSTYDDILSFPVKNSDALLKKFKELEYNRTLKKPTYKIEGIKYAYSIIVDLLNSEYKKYTPTAKQQKINPAIDYIAKNYNTEIKNDDLAKICGLSTVYFRKLFTKIYGISPISYVHKLRIKKAKEMLKSDYGSISEIALSLGYANIYDFSRVFKKQTGTSPSKYQ